jgi:hypothetical protein
MPRDSAPSLSTLRNLGPTTRQWLESINLGSPAALRRVGAIAAYVRLRRSRPGVSINALYALVGALENCDWITIMRTRKLELALRVEDYERRHPQRARPVRDELLALKNIGPAMRRDLALLGISTVAQLARRGPDALYRELQRKTGQRQDLCVWDTFAAAIYQARGGAPRPWWDFTRERKRRMAEGTFMRGSRPTPTR